jgi:hypothetical protein
MRTTSPDHRTHSNDTKWTVFSSSLIVQVFSSLVPHALSPRPIISMRDQVSHPYTSKTSKVIFGVSAAMAVTLCSLEDGYRRLWGTWLLLAGGRVRTQESVLPWRQTEDISCNVFWYLRDCRHSSELTSIVIWFNPCVFRWNKRP